jgi:hypothetical protein
MGVDHIPRTQNSTIDYDESFYKQSDKALCAIRPSILGNTLPLVPYLPTIFVYDKLYICPTRVLNSRYSNCANGSHSFQILVVMMMIQLSFWMIVPNWDMFSQFSSKEE